MLYRHSYIRLFYFSCVSSSEVNTCKKLGPFSVSLLIVDEVVLKFGMGMFLISR